MRRYDFSSAGTSDVTLHLQGKNGIGFTFKIKRNGNGPDVKDGSGSTANNDDPYVCWVYDNCRTGRGDSAGNLSRLFTLASAPSSGGRSGPKMADFGLLATTQRFVLNKRNLEREQMLIYMTSSASDIGKCQTVPVLGRDRAVPQWTCVLFASVVHLVHCWLSSCTRLAAGRRFEEANSGG